MTARNRTLAALAKTAALGLTLTSAPLAHADSANWNKTLADFALGPFNLAVSQNTVYVADGFFGTVGVVGQDPLVSGPDAAGAAGVDDSPNGKTIAWTWTVAVGGPPDGLAGLTVRTQGRPDVTTDLSAAEVALNPDGIHTYGVTDYGTSDKGCVDAVFGMMGPVTYEGHLDSHPYSVVRAGDRWVVADAGANNLWSVSDAGVATNLAVLPPQPVTITAAMLPGLAAMFGAPVDALACLEGVTYAFEAVPTDVEVATDGTLWVSVLPGGPEGPALGARGAVYTVDPATGASTRVAGGFLGATNLAVAPDGTVYVTELFGGTISKIDRRGTVSTQAAFDRPLSIEVAGGHLYVGQMAAVEFGPDPTQPPTITSPGSVVRLKR